MSDVFISHSSKDKEIADKIVAYLEERGLTCWIAPRDIIPGMDWAAISTAITASKVFLIIYSENSSVSDQVAREISLAESKKNVFVVPYRIDHAELTGSFEYYLTGAHWVISDHKKKNYNFEELYTNIINITGKNVQNITNNTYIDHLHMHGVDQVSPDLGQQIQNQLEPSGVNGYNMPAPVMNNVPTNKSNIGKIAIIASAAAVVAICAVVGVIIAVSGSSKNVPVESSAQASASSETAVQSSVYSTAESNISAPHNVTNHLIDIKYIDWTVSCSYSGPVNSDGKPDGKGSLTGDYSDSKTSFSLTYEGDFSNGVFSGNGTSTKTESDGKTRVYNGEWSNGDWNGKGTQTVTYKTGDIDKKIYEGTFKESAIISVTETDYYTSGKIRVYDGEWADGHWNGKGTVTVTNRTEDIEKTIYDCIYKGGSADSGTQTDYYTDGRVRVYDGEWADGNWNGKGTLTFTYKTGDIEKSIYEATYKDGSMISGTETDYFTDGDVRVYDGEWADGHWNGKGTLTYTYKTGDTKNWILEGTFKDGKATSATKTY